MSKLHVVACPQAEVECLEQDRLDLALKLYETNALSTGLAARLAGVSRTDFFYILGEHGLSPFGVEPDELESDIRNALQAIRRPSN